MTDTAIPEKGPAKGVHVESRSAVQRALVWIPIALSTVAILIASLSLRISWLQYGDNHRQQTAQGNPLIEFETDTDVDDMPVGISLTNPGPAVEQVKDITFYFDRKPLDDLQQLFDIGKLDNISSVELREGATLSVGEKVWLISVKDKPKGKQGPKNMDRFVDVLENHVAVEAEVCSLISGKCYTECSNAGWCK